MNFRDRWAENEQGEQFVFTVEMQRKLSQLGLPIEPESLSQIPEQEAPQPVSEQSRERREPREYERREPREHESREHEPRKKEAEIVGPATIQIDPQTGKYVGRVKWYNAKKGYGFIVRGAGEEIFFHKSGTVGDMEEFDEGQWILYDVEETNKGPEATDVEPYTGEPIE